MLSRFRWKRSDPLRRAFINFCFGIAGISVGLFCIIPAHEEFGNLWTMVWAIATGIFYTRYVGLKKGRQGSSSES